MTVDSKVSGEKIDGSPRSHLIGNVVELFYVLDVDVVLFSGGSEPADNGLFRDQNRSCEVGAGYFDLVSQAISGGTTSTLALAGSTEEDQF